MKGNWKKKIIAGLTGALIFFGGNVFASVDTESIKQNITPGRIGAVVGIICILVVLGVVYKIDENQEYSVDSESPKKEKKSKGKPQTTDYTPVDETIIPYESETNEQYVPDNIEPVISADDEDNSLFQDYTQDTDLDEDQDSEMNFGYDENQEEGDEEFADDGLSSRIDELDDIEDADSDIGKFSEKNTYNNNLNTISNDKEVQDSIDNMPAQDSDNDSFGFTTDLGSEQEDETIEDFDEDSGEIVDLSELDDLDDIEGAEEIKIPDKPIEVEEPKAEEPVHEESDEFQGFSLDSTESEETADDFAGFSTEEPTDKYDFQGFEEFAAKEDESSDIDSLSSVNNDVQNNSEDTKTEDDIDNFFLSQMEETMKKSQNFDTNDAVPEKTQAAKTTKAPKTTKTTKATKTTTTTKRITKKKTDK